MELKGRRQDGSVVILVEVGDPIVPMPRASRYAIHDGEHLVRHLADVGNTLFLTARAQVEVRLVRD